jgi:hypothetical protein
MDDTDLAYYEALESFVSELAGASAEEQRAQQRQQ